MTGARGYSWPPFEAGNEAALTHGAYSPRRVNPRAAEIRERLLAEAPWLAPPAFARSVDALARAEARVELLAEFIDEHGLLDDDGQPRSALAALEKAEKAAERLRSTMGLSPTSWAGLYRTLAAQTEEATTGGLAALKRTGAQIIEATTTRPAEITAGDDEGNDDGR